MSAIDHQVRGIGDGQHEACGIRNDGADEKIWKWLGIGAFRSRIHSRRQHHGRGIIGLFIRRFWATLIRSLAIPVSLVCAGDARYVLGYSLDGLSFMALTIAVGFVVDDAIVMIENITRHVDAGEPPLNAASRGAREITFTIIAMTTSLIAVFIPLFFMSFILRTDSGQYTLDATSVG